MKKVTLLFAVPALLLSSAAFAANTADLGQQRTEASADVKPAFEIAVYTKDARGVLASVGSRLTRGEPVPFSKQFS